MAHTSTDSSNRGRPSGPCWEVTVEDVERTKRGLVSDGCEIVKDASHVPRCYVKDPFDLIYNLTTWLLGDGVLDLRRAWELRLSRGVVADLLGGTPDDVPRYNRDASPIELLPLAVPVRLIHGTNDDTVPIDISRRYQAAASARGDDVKLL